MTRGCIYSAVLVLGAVSSLSACAGTDQPSSNLSNDQKASERASVDIVNDCSKPWFDTVSASDHKTIVKGMTPMEREVCSTILRTGNEPGR